MSLRFVTLTVPKVDYHSPVFFLRIFEAPGSSLSPHPEKGNCADLQGSIGFS